MSRYEIAQPTNDLAFKKLFANPDDTFILTDFLKAVLGEHYNFTIESVSLVEPVILPESNDGKQSAFDVFCTDSTGRKFIVEMQVLANNWSKERAQWYVCKAYSDRVKRAQKYKEARQVFLIAILGFNMFPEHDRYISYHTFRDEFDQKLYFDGLGIAILELKKFKEQNPDKFNENIEFWFSFFNQYQEKNILDKLCQKSQAIEKATQVLTMHNWEDDERAVYEKMELIAWDQEAIAETNKIMQKQIEQAKVQIEESNKQIEESNKRIVTQAKELELAEQKIKFAEEKARLEAERKTKLELAQKLLKTGMPVKEASVFTGLDEKDLN